MSSVVVPRQEVESNPPTGMAGRTAPDRTIARAQRNKVLLTTFVPEQKTAWTKARMDVLQLLTEQGYQMFQLPTGTQPRQWLKLLADLHRTVGEGGHVVIEYPFDQRKRVYMLHMFCKLRKVKLYGLIHDLDSLRFGDPKSREIAILDLFDGLISHNPTMTHWLRDGGVRGKLVNLNLFDYLSPAGRTWHEESMTSPMKVLCAGNLSPPKAGYIYDPRLGELQNVQLSLFGAFFEPERMPPSPVEFKGVFDPNTPKLDGAYHFGLIWDGSSVDSCQGNYGHYMRYNNPHKLSLYVSLGLPVAVWKEAAIANFVQARDIGVTIGDLRDLGRVPEMVSTERYRKMAENVARLSQKVKRGDFLNDALRALLAR